jgi:dTDP-glucose 4,6-dehydratase
MTFQKKSRDAHVLVTGGAGFIGSEVTRQLVRSGARVTVLDNFASGKKAYLRGLQVDVVKADICDRKAVSRSMQDQEIVYHLAALPFIPDSYLNPQEFFRVNVEGTLNLLWKAIHSETVKRFVYISSSEVYGTAQKVPMDESHPTQPHSTYAVSKLAADRAVFTLHKEQGFPVVVLRPFNSYGPRITQPYIIPEITIQLLEGRGCIRLGNTKSSRDFTFVADTARAILLASFSDRAIGEVINIGSGTETSIRDLARLIARITKTRFVFQQDESRIRPYDVDRLVCDNSKAKSLLGWKPEVQLESGLRETTEWIRKNRVKFKAPFKGAISWYRS